MTRERVPQRMLAMQSSTSEAAEMAIDAPSSSGAGRTTEQLAVDAAQHVVAAAGLDPTSDLVQQCAVHLEQALLSLIADLPAQLQQAGHASGNQ